MSNKTDKLHTDYYVLLEENVSLEEQIRLLTEDRERLKEEIVVLTKEKDKYKEKFNLTNLLRK